LNSQHCENALKIIVNRIDAEEAKRRPDWERAAKDAREIAYAVLDIDDSQDDGKQ
jgi:hypothetical protein